MAAIVTTPFANVQILIGDGASPTEGFTFLAGLTSKAIDWNADTVTSEVPDGADESLPAFQEKDIKSVGASISGNGMWAKASHGILLDWIRTGTPKNIKLRYMDAAVGETEFVNGPAVLTKLGHAVDKGARLSADIAIEFSRTPTVIDKA